MIKEGKFGVQEAVCLVTITTCTKVFFSSPALVARTVGTAGWYMTLISCTTSMVAFAFIYLLLKRFPGKNIVEIFNISLGRGMGFVFSFIFAASFIVSAGVLLREFCDILKIFVFPDILISALIAPAVIGAGIAAFLGLESIARASKLSGYVLLVSYIVLLILSSREFKFSNIFPLLGFGLDKTIIHGIRRSSAYDEFVVLTVFAGSLQGTRYIKRAGIISLILSGLIISSGVVSYALAFPYYTTQELATPLYVMTRAIKYGTFVQRLDPIFLFLWNTATFISVSVLLYTAVSVYCKMFRLQDTRPVIIPMGVILFSTAMAPRDYTSVIQGLVQKTREYGWAVFYVLPVVALIAAILRKKRGDGKNA